MRRLIIRPGAIGDLIVSLPALEFLRAEYTEVWTTSQNAPLIRFADRVRSIASTGLDMLELGQAVPGLTEELRTFDVIDSWYGANRPEFQDAVRVLRLPFVFHAALPRGPEHATDFYLAQVGGRPGAVPRLDVPEASPDNRVVIHPFASNPAKRWPLERFQELARWIGDAVEWLAGPEEELAGAVRIADLYELACRIAGARLYIGNDSGISHLAAACGVRTVVFFGPTDPGIWAPRGDVLVLPARMTAEEAYGSINPARMA